MMKLTKIQYLALAALLFLFAPLLVQAEGLVVDQSFSGKNAITVQLSGAVDKNIAENVANYTVFEEADPDIILDLASACCNRQGSRRHRQDHY
jgi:hypothetical protein